MASGREDSGSTLNGGSRSQRRREGFIKEDKDSRENLSDFVTAVTALAPSVPQPQRGHDPKDPASMFYRQLFTRGNLIDQLTSIDSKMKEAGPNLLAILQNQFDSIAKALDRISQCDSFAD